MTDSRIRRSTSPFTADRGSDDPVGRRRAAQQNMADGHPRRNGLRTADTHTDPPAVDRDGTQSQHGSRSRVGYDADAATSGKEWVSVHFQASYSAAQIGGPLLAGLLITVAPVQQVLWVDAASFLASAGSLLLISTACNAGRPEGEGRRAIRREVADGLVSVLATRYCATSRP
jgi:hypothetical protein